MPPASCRAGRVVQMINASGAKVPVKLGISVKEEGEALNYVVKVQKSSKEADFDDRALKLKVSQEGESLGKLQEIAGCCAMRVHHCRPEMLDHLLLAALAPYHSPGPSTHRYVTWHSQCPSDGLLLPCRRDHRGGQPQRHALLRLRPFQPAGPEAGGLHLSV